MVLRFDLHIDELGVVLWKNNYSKGRNLSKIKISDIIFADRSIVLRIRSIKYPWAFMRTFVIGPCMPVVRWTILSSYYHPWLKIRVLSIKSLKYILVSTCVNFPLFLLWLGTIVNYLFYSLIYLIPVENISRSI